MWNQSDPFAIVLCTYNGERFLELQLQSLREQDGVAEIVVSDDGSTDGTLGLLQRHAAADPRIRLFRTPRNLGVTANFEHAIGLARAPWIALADQDDIWLPGKLARMRARWDGESCLLHHASRKFRGTGMPRHTGHRVIERRKFSGRDWRGLLHRNSIVGHTIVFRADLRAQLVPFPQALPHDWWLGVGAALHGSVQFVDECLVHYRMHRANTYRAAGSRLRRLRGEYEMRLTLLRAMLARKELPASGREFVRRHLALLQAAPAGGFPWRLWRFYLAHAPLFFSSERFTPSRFTCVRKSFAVALGAAWQGLAGSAAGAREFAAR